MIQKKLTKQNTKKRAQVRLMRNAIDKQAACGLSGSALARMIHGRTLDGRNVMPPDGLCQAMKNHTAQISRHAIACGSSASRHLPVRNVRLRTVSYRSTDNASIGAVHPTERPRKSKDSHASPFRSRGRPDLEDFRDAMSVPLLHRVAVLTTSRSAERTSFRFHAERGNDGGDQCDILARQTKTSERSTPCVG